MYLGTQTELLNQGGAQLNGQLIQGGQADAEAALLLKGGLLNRGFGSSSGLAADLDANLADLEDADYSANAAAAAASMAAAKAQSAAALAAQAA